MSSVKRGIPEWALFFLAATPLVFLFVLFDRYTVNVPFRDTVPYVFWLMEKAFLNSSITVQDFFHPVAEHILAVPMFFYMVSAWMTGGDYLAEMFLMFWVAVLQVILLAVLAWSRSDRASRIPALATLVLSAVLIASPAQWESWTLSLVLSYSLTFLFLLLALVLLDRFGLRTWVMACVVMLMGSVPFACPNGLFAGLSLLPMLWTVRGTPRRRIVTLALLLVTTGLSVLVYQQTAYFFAAKHETYLLVFHDPLLVLGHFFTLTGAAVIPDGARWPLVCLFGIVVLAGAVLAVAALRKDPARLKDAMPWICLLLFALISTGLISLGRTGYGFASAFVSRYFTVSQFIAIATVFLLARVVRWRWVVPLVVLAMIAMHLPYYPAGIRQWALLSGQQRHAAGCLRAYAIAPEACLDWLYPWDIPQPHLARAAAPVLLEMGFLEPFAMPESATFLERSVPERGRIERVGGLPIFPELTGTGTVIGGWAVLPECRPAQIVVTAGEERRVIGYAVPAVPRPDVSDCPLAGWEAEIGRLPENGAWEAWVFDEGRGEFLRLAQ